MNDGMPVFQEFEQVARLDEVQLSRLLADGDPQERVWAGWALATRADSQSRDRLRDAFASDAHPGVRRHHLVVLVSLGEHELVATTAARDRDAHVRATATRYLSRLAEPDHHGAYDLIVARTLDLEWCVRFEVADALRIDAPEAVVRAVAGLLFDPDPDVRWAMRRRLQRGDFASEPFEAALEVLRRMDALVDDPHAVGPPSSERALVLYRPLRPV